MQAVKLAGIESNGDRIGWHSFRHGCVSALIRAGADPVRISRFVGDRVETVLSTYAHEWASQQGDDLADVLGEALSTGGAS